MIITNSIFAHQECLIYESRNSSLYIFFFSLFVTRVCMQLILGSCGVDLSSTSTLASIIYFNLIIKVDSKMGFDQGKTLILIFSPNTEQVVIDMALIPCWIWWRINPIAPKNHLNANTCHRKREEKATEVGIHRSQMRHSQWEKREIAIIKSEWINYKEINPYKRRLKLEKGNLKPKKYRLHIIINIKY